MKQTYQCFIKTLSPIHIGCDEVYEPMGFVVDESRNELTAFDPITFISQMNENDKKCFSDICLKGTIESILEIYKFLRRKQASGKSVQLCAGFVDHYNKTLSIATNDKRRIQQELGSFAIARTSFLSADERPYIPGSSVKGSLRTAYLNRMARGNPIPTPSGRHGASELEKKLLSYNDIPTDPFRLVKVSDFMPVGNVQSKIVYAVNIKKESGSAAKGPFQIVETIVPGTVFSGNIVVEKPLSERAVQKPIQLDALLQSGRTFYSKERNREQSELKAAGVSAPDAFFGKGTIPIRIGRHSGAESVTIEGHRNIKIMAKKRENTRFEEDHATTLWLASEESKPQSVTHCKPFGWAELCEITPLLEQELEKMEKDWTEGESTRKKIFFIQESIAENSSVPQPPLPPVKKAPDPEIWGKAVLSWAANTGTVTAKWEGKNATAKDKTIISETLLEQLKKKRKLVMAKVKTELIGGKEYQLVEIVKAH